MARLKSDKMISDTKLTNLGRYYTMQYNDRRKYAVGSKLIGKWKVKRPLGCRVPLFEH